MTDCGVGRVTRARSPGADLDEAHAVELQQRLPDRGAADAEVAHQLALGGQPVGFREGAVPDHALQVLRHVLREPPLSNQPALHLAYLLYQGLQLTGGGPGCQTISWPAFRNAR